MQVVSCGHSYLKRDSRDSQISFCFTVFQEKSSSSKAKRVRTVILHLFSHVDSFFRPWTKRMQYPMLGEKKKGKAKCTESYISSVWFICKTIQYCIYYTITGGFGLMIFSGLTNFNSTAVFLKSLHNFQINLNDRPGCQKYSRIHNTTQHNGSLHQPQKAAAFLNSKLRKHHVITAILSTTGAAWK